MVKYFNGVTSIPLGFSGAKRAKQLNIISRFITVCTGWAYSPGYSDTISLSVDKNIKLHAVRLFGSDNSEYSVSLTVQDINMVVVASKAGNFLSEQVQSVIGNYQGFEIVFTPPIALQGNKIYRFVAQINGPNSWYGQVGQFSVEHSGGEIPLCRISRHSNLSSQGAVFSIFVYSGLGKALSCIHSVKIPLSNLPALFLKRYLFCKGGVGYFREP